MFERTPHDEILRSRRNKVGYALCYTGQFSETVCGRTESIGRRTANGVQGLAVLKRFRCGAEDTPIGGDSGAPVFKKHAAFGILRAHLPGRCRTIYSGAIQAEDQLNVNIRTTP
jgi:hypothetical protein